MYALSLVTDQRETLCLANVTSKDARAAFDFHEKVAAVPDSHLWARSESQIRKLIKHGCLYGAWLGEDRQLVGLCYALLNEKEQTWEIGGLSVDKSVGGRGIGTILVRFALAHTIVYEQPWVYGQEVIAHVHEANEEPRGILEKSGFEFSRLIPVPEEANPPSWMRRNAEGKIIGHEFKYPPRNVKALSDWFDQELDKLERVAVKFDLGPSDIEDLKTDLREIAEDFA